MIRQYIKHKKSMKNILMFVCVLAIFSSIINAKIYPNLKAVIPATTKYITIDGKSTKIRIDIYDKKVTYYCIQDLCNAMDLKYEKNYQDNTFTISDNYNMIKLQNSGSNTIQFNQKFMTRTDLTWYSTFGDRDYISLKVFAEGMHYNLTVNGGKISLTSNKEKVSHINSIFGTDFPNLRLNYKYAKPAVGESITIDNYNRYVIENTVETFVDAQYYFDGDDGGKFDKHSLEYRVEMIKEYKEKVQGLITLDGEDLDSEVIAFAETTLSTLDSYIVAYNQSLTTSSSKIVFSTDLNKAIQNFYNSFSSIFDTYVSAYYDTSEKPKELPQRDYFFVPKIYINSQQINMQHVYSFPYIKGESLTPTITDIYVPLKVICTNLGAKIIFDAKEKKTSVEYNGKTTEVTKQEVDNGVVLVPLDFIGTALGAEVSFENDQIYIKGNFTYKSTGVQLPIADIKKYGNSFEGIMNNREREEDYDDTYYKKVIIAKRSDLPINIGNMIIYDVYTNGNITFPGVLINQKAKASISFPFKAGKTFTVKMKRSRADSWASEIYISCMDGLNRARSSFNYVTKQGDAKLQYKDKNGITTALYPVTQLGDQFIYQAKAIGKEYQDFTLDDAKYFVFKGDDILLAIPRSEVVK